MFAQCKKKELFQIEFNYWGNKYNEIKIYVLCNATKSNSITKLKSFT